MPIAPHRYDTDHFPADLAAAAAAKQQTTMSGWISGGGAQRKRARQAGATGAAFHGEFWFCWTPKSKCCR